MRILIADDESHSGNLLAALVQPWGYEPVVVHDGLAALEALNAPDAPPLALLDWKMPGLDGIEVCRAVRKADQPYGYLILVTGLGGRQQMLEGLEAGADEFLTKPVEPAELKAHMGAGRRIIAMQEQLRDRASRDALTGLWNRAGILRILDRELDRGYREHRPVAVVLADLDHFKRINDTLGHLAGDHVLCEATQRLVNSVRPYDAVGRYGGEEFLVVLPGCENDTARSLAERLRQCIAAERIDVDGTEVQVTLSLGVAVAAGQAEPAAVELLRAADAALYEAKRAGRNRVQLGTPTTRTHIEPHRVDRLAAASYARRSPDRSLRPGIPSPAQPHDEGAH
jgi:two-component system cell cycle response regulator